MNKSLLLSKSKNSDLINLITVPAPVAIRHYTRFSLNLLLILTLMNISQLLCHRLVQEVQPVFVEAACGERNIIVTTSVWCMCVCCGCMQ